MGFQAAAAAALRHGVARSFSGCVAPPGGGGRHPEGFAGGGERAFAGRPWGALLAAPFRVLGIRLPPLGLFDPLLPGVLHLETQVRLEAAGVHQLAEVVEIAQLVVDWLRALLLCAQTAFQLIKHRLALVRRDAGQITRGDIALIGRQSPGEDEGRVRVVRILRLL